MRQAQTIALHENTSNLISQSSNTVKVMYCNICDKALLKKTGSQQTCLSCDCSTCQTCQRVFSSSWLNDWTREEDHCVAAQLQVSDVLCCLDRAPSVPQTCLNNALMHAVWMYFYFLFVFIGVLQDKLWLSTAPEHINSCPGGLVHWRVTGAAAQARYTTSHAFIFVFK